MDLRVGSLEMTAALLGAALVAIRPRLRSVAEGGRWMPMRVALDVVEFGGQPRAFEGRAPVSVGRSSEADLMLRDPEVSRLHARFESRNGVVYVDDLGSSNGTFLNGRRVTESIEVREGDRVDAGTTRMVIREIRRAETSWT